MNSHLKGGDNVMNITTNNVFDILSRAAADVSDTGHVPHLTPDTQLAELAFDSVQLAELVSTVAEHIGARVSLDRFYGAETLGDLMAVLGSDVLT